uniref:Uncharacterized protein n=1 Tax=Rhizophora mucronata TaxID=61149 RepID=A0A2P2PKU7_RHIMU
MVDGSHSQSSLDQLPDGLDLR